MNRKRGVYAVYHNDDFICIDTIDNITRIIHSTENAIHSTISKSKKDKDKKGYYIFKIGETTDDKN